MPKKSASSSNTRAGSRRAAEIEEFVCRANEKSVLLSISEGIATVRDKTDLLRLIIERIKPVFDFYDCGIFVFDREKKTLEDLAVSFPGISPSETNDMLAQKDAAKFQYQGSAWESVFETMRAENKPIVFNYKKNQAAGWSDYVQAAALERIGYEESLMTILSTGGEELGVFAVNSLKEGTFNEAQFSLFQNIANQMAVALSNVLANEEILERAREKTRLLEITELIAQVKAGDDLLRLIVDKIKPLFDFEDCGLFVVSADKQTHQDLAAVIPGVSPSEFNERIAAARAADDIPHSGSVVEAVMREIEAAGKPVLFDFADLVERFPDYPQFVATDILQLGYRDCLAANLVVRGEPIGMFCINALAKNFYQPQIFQLFQAVAHSISIAVSNILANEEILEREREKTVQLEIIHALTAPQTSEELITKIAAEIDKIIRLDAFSLHLQREGEFLDFEYNDLRALRENGDFVPLRRYAFWKKKGVSTEKLRELIGNSLPLLTKKAFYVGDDYRALARENELIRMITESFGFRSAMYAPVRLQNGALMTLAASSWDENAFSAEILDKFCETGAQIALAVESNLSFAEISALKKRLEEENTYLAEEVRTAYDFGEIVGSAPALETVFRRLELVAPTDTTVLLEGETGTGKELFARAIHDLSPRKSRPLIKINCAALPSTLIESELFGHERGAFTGASERRLGKFELANNGTIFLDEIGELPLELQSKLLRVLQEREIERIGGKTPLKINIRVVAATNRDLRSEVAAGRFRQDLFFRLNTVVLNLPSLRERREDIPALALHFAQKYAARIGRRIRGISNKMLAELMKYHFPGNVRELEHIIEEAVIFSKGENLQLHRPLVFTLDQAAPIYISETDSRPLQTLGEIERAHILAVLEKTGGRIRGEAGAAEILSIKPTTLEARMKKLGIKKQHV